MAVISCDPGQTGGICIFENNKLVENVYIPQLPDKSVDIITLLDWFYTWRAVYEHNMEAVSTCMEKVHSMPKQGVSSTFKFGKTTGQLEVLLRTVSRANHTEIRAQDWKKSFGLKGKNKHEAVDLALSMEPKLFSFNKKQEGYINKQRQSGIADAYLMGLYFLSKSHTINLSKN